MSKAWIVASSIAAVEALKDQGICRWNYTMRSLQQHAKNNMRSYTQANKVSTTSPAAAAAAANKYKEEKLKESEESLRKVMYLSCWGPN